MLSVKPHYVAVRSRLHQWLYQDGNVMSPVGSCLILILLLFDLKLNRIRWVAFVFRLALSNFISEVQINHKTQCCFNRIMILY
jgi:hypothetical protein